MKYENSTKPQKKQSLPLFCGNRVRALESMRQENIQVFDSELKSYEYINAVKQTGFVVSPKGRKHVM